MLSSRQLGGGAAGAWVLGVVLLRYDLRRVPHFSFADEKNVSRFVVHRLRSELTGSPTASAPRRAGMVPAGEPVRWARG
jgi:hypothetical protein